VARETTRLGTLTKEEFVEARDLLGTSPLFAGVPPEELEATCLRLTRAPFARDEELIRAREIGDCCYIIRSGQTVVVTDDLIGGAAQVRIAGPGEVLGEIALLKDVLRVATVRAIADTEAFVLDRASFLHLAEAVPVFLRRLRERAELAERVLFLRRASPFARLPEDVVERVARELRQVHVQAGEIVMREGDRAEYFYMVRSGRLEVLRDRRRARQLASGDYVGESAVILGRRRSATVRAREESELLALRGSTFKELVDAYPELEDHFAEALRIRNEGTPVADGAAPSKSPPDSVLPTHRSAFWITLVVGLGIFIALDEATQVYDNPWLPFATAVAGALVGPVAYVVYLASTNVLTRQPRRLAITFLIAGAGVPLAAQAEYALGPLGNLVLKSLSTATIEEVVKVIAVAWLLSRRENRFRMDGVIYGAAAGMGFAAIENINYAILNMATLSQLLGIVWLRLLLSPFTHGTWTAIICAAIWGAKGSGSPRWGWRIPAAFAISVILHTAWDSAPLTPYLYYYYMALGVIGLAILGVLVREARSEQDWSLIHLNPAMLDDEGNAPRVALVCWNCGDTAPPGAHYCPRCGVALRV
jgi:protease PrsW